MRQVLGLTTAESRRLSPPIPSPPLLQEDELLGHRLPAGSWLILHLQGIHHQYREPSAWRPDRYMPGGEYDQFDAAIRPYMVCVRVFVWGGRFWVVVVVGGGAALCWGAGSPSSMQHW